mmetsp:Transcript_17501/g.47426  ORF Transcript_17501/g.47426 Transcript_17501/m.47426 type:complete len:209 (+) Transcript_17501:67-693(+)
MHLKYLTSQRPAGHMGTRTQNIRISGLVLLALTLSSTISALSANLLKVLLQGSQVLTGLAELSLLHALTNIPVHKSTLGIHEVELVVQTGEDLADCGGVGDHAHRALNLGQVTAWHDSGGLVVDAALEASGAPVHKLDGALGLDGCHSGIDVLGHHIATVHQAAGHVLSMAGVALDHHAGGLKRGIGDLSHRQLLVVGLLSRDDRCVG